MVVQTREPVETVDLDVATDTTVTAVRYGVHYRWTQELPPALAHQMRLCTGLWNSLVTSYEQFEADKAAIHSSFPEVAAIEEEIARLDGAIGELVEQVKAAAIAQRTKRPNHPAVRTLAASKEQLKDARQRRREAILARRDEEKELLTQARAARIERDKQLYAVSTRAGMYWATYNDITRRRMTMATERLGQARSQGRPAQLRTHRHDGTGTITVQLQRAAQAPPRTPAMIAQTDTSPWRNVLAVPTVDQEHWETMTRAQRRHAGRVVVRMRVGQDPDTGAPVWLDIPVQVHRQLPPDADITEARLSVRRVGPDLRAALSVVAKVPRRPRRMVGPDVAVHVGWLDLPGEGIQVASWRSSSPLEIPERLRGVMRTRDGLTGTVVVPERVDARLAALDVVRAGRDEQLNLLKAQLIEAVTDHGPLPNPYDENEPLDAARLGLWRSPGRFVVLARHLDADPDWRDTAPAGLARTWAEQDRRRWAHQEHGRDRILAHRDDLFRNVAATIAAQARCLVTDDMSVAELARLAPHEDEPLPEDVRRAVSRRRAVAAPGRLRESVVAACVREGIEHRQVPAKNLSAEHAVCGYLNDVAANPVYCLRCGYTYDPDRNATKLMFRRATAARGG